MRKPVTTSEVVRIRALLAKGLSLYAVARITGRSEYTVRKYSTEHQERRTREYDVARYQRIKQDAALVERRRETARDYMRRIRAEGGDAL